MSASPSAGSHGRGSPQASRAPRAAFVVSVALLAVALTGFLARSVVVVPSIFRGDYLTYVAGATRYLDGQPLYPAWQLEGPFPLGFAAYGRGFVYPPPAVLAAVPFAALGEPAGFALFSLLAASLLGWVAYAIGRREGCSRRASLVLAVVMLVSPPAIESIATGQANTFVAIGLGAAWLRPRQSGYLAVIGGLLKLFPAAGLAWTLRRRGSLAGPVMLGTSIMLLSLLLFGVDGWRAFALTMANGHGSNTWGAVAPRLLLELVIGPGAAAIACYAAAVALLVAAVRVRSDRLAFGIMALAMILPAPDWYVHYLLIPLVGVLPAIAVRLAAWRQVRATLTGTGADEPSAQSAAGA